VMSDGIFDAENGNGESFGPQRVTALLEERHDASAGEILDALRRAVGAFTSRAAAEDDRTVIIVKRAVASPAA
jgi:sigma-B regulation protein RsbU (phosphoserine phosphatase)